MVSQSVLCLPFFIVGCRKFVCLVGPTFSTRLWCLMELFFFLKTNRSLTDALVVRRACHLSPEPGAASPPKRSHPPSKEPCDAHPICARHPPQIIRLPSGKDQVDIVDANKAHCSTIYDKESLLGVVEASYGTSAEFNKVLLHVLNGGLVQHGACVAPAPGEPSSLPQPPMPDENPQPPT